MSQGRGVLVQLPHIKVSTIRETARWRVLLLAACGILAAATAGHGQEGSCFVGGLSTGPDLVYTIVATGGTRLAPGDTFRVRQVLLNGGDSTIDALVRPCGLRLETDMELRGWTGGESCPPEERSLAPGDSIWTEARGIVDASSGPYRVTTDHAGVGSTGGHGFGVHVGEAEARDDVRGSDCATPLVEKVFFVVELSDRAKEAGFEEGDVASVVSEVAFPSFMALRMEPAAAEAILRTGRYLEVGLDVDESGFQETRICWVSGEARGPGGCDVSRGLFGVLSLGAHLAEEVLWYARVEVRQESRQPVAPDGSETCDGDFDGAFLGAIIGAVPGLLVSLDAPPEHGNGGPLLMLAGAIAGFWGGLAHDSMDCDEAGRP